MDEKKVREAIAWMENERRIHKYGTHISPSIPKEQISKIGECYDLAIEALEKQLPKEAVKRSLVKDNGIVVGPVGRCPCCNEIIDDTMTVCDCGQKIDWSE